MPHLKGSIAHVPLRHSELSRYFWRLKGASSQAGISPSLHHFGPAEAPAARPIAFTSVGHERSSSCAEEHPLRRPRHRCQAT